MLRKTIFVENTVEFFMIMLRNPQKDVSLRVEKFISKVKLEKKTAVITHNVILRVLIGKALDLPINSWFKLNPGHLEIHNFIFIQNKLIPALTKDQRIRYKNLTKNEN